MELKNHKSALAALATLGVTAVAAGATAFVKIRERRRQRAAEEEEGRLSAEQMMVYNEAVSAFLSLNDRIYELRRYRKELQPLILWLATDGTKPMTDEYDAVIQELAADIQKFLTTQLPFINACLSTVSNDGLTYNDYVHAPITGTFDDTLDEVLTGDEVKDGTPISFVLKLGYYFPGSTLAPNPVKSIVLT